MIPEWWGHPASWEYSKGIQQEKPHTMTLWAEMLAGWVGGCRVWSVMGFMQTRGTYSSWPGFLASILSSPQALMCPLYDWWTLFPTGKTWHSFLSWTSNTKRHRTQIHWSSECPSGNSFKKFMLVELSVQLRARVLVQYVWGSGFHSQQCKLKFKK